MHGSPTLLLTQGSGLGNQSTPSLTTLSEIDMLRPSSVQRMGTSQLASIYQGTMIGATLH